MLQAYPNLYIDLSWSMLTPYLLDEAGKPRAQWLKLVERFLSASWWVRTL